MIRLITIGRIKDRRLANLAEDYIRRIKPLAPISVVELKDQALAKEERQLLAALGSPVGSEMVIALDERGDSIDSAFLAGLLGSHGSLAFLVGGPDGLTDRIKERADRVMRLSRLTLTHEWARVLLLEQIYRGLAILRGLPYHRGDRTT